MTDKLTSEQQATLDGAVRVVAEATERLIGRTYGIGNAPRPKVGDRIRVPYAGKIIRATVTALLDDRVEVTIDGHLHEVHTSCRVTVAPQTCECGSGSNSVGPGHSDWCCRYARDGGAA